MKIIGHCGARGLSPENTIASLNKALAHHVDELEFDLRVTRDGVVILHHDPFVTDPDGEKHVIEDHSYDQLLKHKKDMATFEQVLDAIDPSETLYIEVKPDEPTVPIIKIIKNYYAKGWKPEHLLLASFSQKILLELQDALPEINKIVLEKWSGVRASHRARQLGTKYISMNQKWLWWGFIRSVAKSDYKLYAYVLNDSVKAKRWAKHGLYGVVTDYPDLFEK